MENMEMNINEEMNNQNCEASMPEVPMEEDIELTAIEKLIIGLATAATAAASVWVAKKLTGPAKKLYERIKEANNDRKAIAASVKLYRKELIAAQKARKNSETSSDENPEPVEEPEE